MGAKQAHVSEGCLSESRASGSSCPDGVASSTVTGGWQMRSIFHSCSCLSIGGGRRQIHPNHRDRGELGIRVRLLQFLLQPICYWSPIPANSNATILGPIPTNSNVTILGPIPEIKWALKKFADQGGGGHLAPTWLCLCLQWKFSQLFFFALNKNISLRAFMQKEIHSLFWWPLSRYRLAQLSEL
jgi:hypothetical protein